MNDDYGYLLLVVRQRHRDFAAEAAQDRLAQLATAGRPSRRRRLRQALLPQRTVRPRTTVQPCSAP